MRDYLLHEGVPVYIDEDDALKVSTPVAKVAKQLPAQERQRTDFSIGKVEDDNGDEIGMRATRPCSATTRSSTTSTTTP